MAQPPIYDDVDDDDDDDDDEDDDDDDVTHTIVCFFFVLDSFNSMESPNYLRAKNIHIIRFLGKMMTLSFSF